MEIDVALVRRLVGDQFPRWAALPVEPVPESGWDNRTFRLGEELAVRLPSAACYAAQVAKEQRWLPELAARLPLPIPRPVAEGAPGRGYPWSWSVYRWLPGETARPERIDDLGDFARDLAGFLRALWRVDPEGGPAPGPHCFFRGGPPSCYDAETRAAIDALGGRIDAAAARELWEAALAAPGPQAPAWVHGDVAATNLLVREGRLSAVIDFGCCAVGDPACDLTVTWTFFSGPGRAAFREALDPGEGAWARARGWALWKALITVAERVEATPAQRRSAEGVLDDLLEEACPASSTSRS